VVAEGAASSVLEGLGMDELPLRLVRIQGAYYLLTGVWSLVHRRSFEAITGPKRDYWLVQTVGALVIVIGGLLVSMPRGRRVESRLALAFLSAVALAAIDLRHGLPGRISRVYAVEGILELAFAGAAARSLLEPTQR
jgi:hypothetical protein